MKPVSTDGFRVRERVFKGFRTAIVKGSTGVRAFIDRGEGETPFAVTHPDGRDFQHAQSAISTAKTVIAWHLKFGGWRLPN